VFAGGRYRSVANKGPRAKRLNVEALLNLLGREESRQQSTGKKRASKNHAGDDSSTWNVPPAEAGSSFYERVPRTAFAWGDLVLG
jgi:hypothetical protein